MKPYQLLTHCGLAAELSCPPRGEGETFNAQSGVATEPCSAGGIELRLGSLAGKLIGTCKVENMGGPQTWKDGSCEVSSATGVQDLYLKFASAEGALFNVDSWKFD